jgi:hypothetical protein
MLHTRRVFLILATAMSATPALGKGIYYREIQTLYQVITYHHGIFLMNQRLKTRR